MTIIPIPTPSLTLQEIIIIIMVIFLIGIIAGIVATKKIKKVKLSDTELIVGLVFSLTTIFWGCMSYGIGIPLLDSLFSSLGILLVIWGCLILGGGEREC